MRNKPLYLKLFPIFSFGIALSFPIQISILYGIELSNISKIISMLTPLNILSMMILIIAGSMTMSLSRKIYKTIPLLIFVLFVNNLMVGLYGTDYNLIQVGLSFLLLGLSLKPFYSHQIMNVIYNPKLRWWKTAQRYHVRKPMLLSVGDLEIHTEATNLSKTGLFTKIDNDKDFDLLQVDQIVKLNVQGDKDISINARIVRKAEEENLSGFGLEIIKNKDHSDKYLPWLKSLVT